MLLQAKLPTECSIVQCIFLFQHSCLLFNRFYIHAVNFICTATDKHYNIEG